jgi:hypothetical protein
MKIQKLETDIKNISIEDGRGKQFSYWGQVCVRDSVTKSECSNTSFKSPITLMEKAGINLRE